MGLTEAGTGGPVEVTTPRTVSAGMVYADAVVAAVESGRVVTVLRCSNARGIVYTYVVGGVRKARLVSMDGVSYVGEPVARILPSAVGVEGEAGR